MGDVGLTETPGDIPAEVIIPPDGRRLVPARLWPASPWNSSACSNASWCNLTGDLDDPDVPGGANYAAVVLVLIPLLTVFGNSLVIVSVIREKSLRTVTNYFITSLATSDVMVALLVMPLSIYGEVRPKWRSDNDNEKYSKMVVQQHQWPEWAAC